MFAFDEHYFDSWASVTPIVYTENKCGQIVHYDNEFDYGITNHDKSVMVVYRENYVVAWSTELTRLISSVPSTVETITLDADVKISAAALVLLRKRFRTIHIQNCYKRWLLSSGEWMFCG